MIKNIYKLLTIMLVAFSGVANAQYCVTGCNDNTFLNSNDPKTLEYDNIVGLYHATMMKEANGTLKVWGASASPSGTSQLSPIAVTSGNGFNYTGYILKFTGSGGGGSNSQMVVLAGDGLYYWGKTNILVSTAVKNTAGFGKSAALSTVGISGTNDTGLPMGVRPGEVKMLVGTMGSLVVVTCSGDVYVLSRSKRLLGDNTSADESVWHQVKTDASTMLKNVVAVRGTGWGMMALTSTGEIYTWGSETYLGDNSAVTNRGYATKMTLPAGVAGSDIKMISTTGHTSYYILTKSGLLYSLGDNSARQLGIFNSTAQLQWVQVQSKNDGTKLTDIGWISTNDHNGTATDSYGYGAVAALANNGELWAWGANSSDMLGPGSSTLDPRSLNATANSGLTSSDKLMAVAMGGHTMVAIKQCTLKYGYIGHKTAGSMGDGTNDDAAVPKFNFADTAEINLCGAPSAPAVKDLKICPGNTADLATSVLSTAPIGYKVQWYSDSAGTVLVSNPNQVGVGTYYAYYVSNSGGIKQCPNMYSKMTVTYFQLGDPQYDVCVGLSCYDSGWNNAQATTAGAVKTYTVGSTTFDATYTLNSGNAVFYPSYLPGGIFGSLSLDMAGVRNGTMTVGFSKPIYSMDLGWDDFDMSETTSFQFYDQNNNLIPTTTLQAALVFSGAQTTVTYPVNGTIKVVGENNGNISGADTQIRFNFPVTLGISRIVATAINPKSSDNDMVLMGGCITPKTFTCNNNIYLSQDNGTNPTTLYNVNTSVLTNLSFDAIGSTAGIRYNAIGFHPSKGYIYGIKTGANNNNLIQIDNTGTATNLGAIANLPTNANSNYIAGEIDDLGNYYVKLGSDANKFYKIDIDTKTATAITMTLPTSVDTTKQVLINDFAYSTVDQKLYGVVNYTHTTNGFITGQFFSMDPATGTVSFIGTTKSPSDFGAMIGAAGEIYGFSNAGGFYKFNLVDGNRTKISNSPGSANNDAAHCVTSSIEKFVCFNDPNLTGTAQETKVGITLLKRAGSKNNDNWPMVRKGGHIALESNTQGFVITRMDKANLGNITNPQEGMMVYDKTDACLKIYADGAWKCFDKASCP